MNSRIEELTNILRDASNAYYNGKELMPNKEYDELSDELRKLEKEENIISKDSPTIKVGADPVDSLPKFKHIYPALSLDKTKDENEFINTFRKGINDPGNKTHNRNVVLMYKEDGSTLNVHYVNGKLDKLVTRGNGEVGSIVTHNIGCISGIPLEIPYEIDLIVRGEAVMSYSEFNRINDKLPEDEQFANPRNLAAATLTMLDSKEASKRHLMFQAFNLVYITPDVQVPKYLSLDKFSDRFIFLFELGFNVVPYYLIDIDFLSADMHTMTEKVQDYDYPVDGLVCAMDNYQFTKNLVGTEHHPHVLSGYAFKWADETKETTLREVEWSPSRTGLLNPVAIFDPIELEGTVVKRASLHNVSIMRNMDLRVGNRVTVYKSNKIIPQIDKNLSKDNSSTISYDEEMLNDVICPICKTKAVVVKSSEGVELMECPNPECPEKLIGKLAHFCERDCMNIQGMSEETIKKLVDWGFIKCYADFFRIEKMPAIAFRPGFGKQSWNKMCQASEQARETDFVHFLSALSIPDIGKGQLKALKKYIDENYDVLSAKFFVEGYQPSYLLSKMGVHGFDFSVIDGFGSILANNLSTWIKEHFDLSKNSPEVEVFHLVTLNDTLLTFTDNRNPIAGKSICITGKLLHFANRQALVSKIEELGGKWVDSVSNNTDYLINNDKESTSSKNKKAKTLNIPIISEEDFLKLIGS